MPARSSERATPHLPRARAGSRAIRSLPWICVALLMGCFTARAAQALEKVVIGHSNIRNEIAALWVPQELGLFRKHGLDASIVFIGGGQRMIQAIVSASVPMGLAGATTVASAVAIIQVMGLRNPRIAQLKAEELVDVSILHHLDQSGFIEGGLAR